MSRFIIIFCNEGVFLISLLSDDHAISNDFEMVDRENAQIFRICINMSFVTGYLFQKYRRLLD